LVTHDRGRIRLSDLKPSHLEEAKCTWAATRKCCGEGPIATRTVRLIWMTLTIALNKAVKQNTILRNPCQMVDAPTFTRREMRPLEASAAQAYVHAFSDEPNIGAAVVFAIGSGLRRGELLALRWSDVNLDDGKIRVTRAMERVVIGEPGRAKRTKVELRFKEPKKNSSRCPVELPAFAIEGLRRHRREQEARFENLGIWRTNETLVFDREGQPWCPNTFGLWFAPARDEIQQSPRCRSIVAV
jgi:integrase